MGGKEEKEGEEIHREKQGRFKGSGTEVKLEKRGKQTNWGKGQREKEGKK